MNPKERSNFCGKLHFEYRLRRSSRPPAHRRAEQSLSHLRIQPFSVLYRSLSSCALRSRYESLRLRPFLRLYPLQYLRTQQPLRLQRLRPLQLQQLRHLRLQSHLRLQHLRPLQLQRLRFLWLQSHLRMQYLRPL